MPEQYESKCNSHQGRFPYLKKAPIAEAVFDLRARADEPWKESEVASFLKGKLPEYPNGQSIGSFAFRMEMGSSEVINKQNGTSSGPVAWEGLKLSTQDGRQIASFTRDGFAFSRLQPYTKWEPFRDEALRLWAIHAEISKATEIRRIGIRFINRIEVPLESPRVEDYFEGFASVPGGYPTSSFIHHDVLEIPEKPYCVNLVRTLQRSSSPDQPNVMALILDIDVFTIEPIGVGSSIINRHIEEMRAVKNDLFFRCITERVVNACC